MPQQLLYTDYLIRRCPLPRSWFFEQPEYLKIDQRVQPLQRIACRRRHRIPLVKIELHHSQARHDYDRTSGDIIVLGAAGSALSPHRAKVQY